MATNYIEHLGLGPFLGHSNVPLFFPITSDESWTTNVISKSPEINNRKSLGSAEGHLRGCALLLFRKRKLPQLKHCFKNILCSLLCFAEARDAIKSRAGDNLVFGFTFAAKSTFTGFCDNAFEMFGAQIKIRYQNSAVQSHALSPTNCKVSIFRDG